ncbi:hypothetical protein AB1N83_010686 [Pleurotus pulmonarius]
MLGPRIHGRPGKMLDNIVNGSSSAQPCPMTTLDYIDLSLPSTSVHEGYNVSAMGVAIPRQILIVGILSSRSLLMTLYLVS